MINRMAQPLLALPRPVKRALALTVDALLCLFSVWLAFALRLEHWIPLTDLPVLPLAMAVGLALPLFVMWGLYRAIFRYSGGAALAAVIQACMLFGLAYFMLFTVVGVPGVPRSLGLLVPLLTLFTVGGSRILARYWLGGMYMSAIQRKALPQVVIYGAGSAGRQLAAAAARSREMMVHAFVDDAPALQGRTLDGIRIHAPDWLQRNAGRLGITDVLLAVPSTSRTRRAQILDKLLPMHLHVRTLPGLSDLMHGRVRMQDLVEVEIDDLLGRDAVPPVNDLLQRDIGGHVVLVTGAGGSIGSELCRQIVQHAPSTLLLLELNEYALYAIHQELEQLAPGVRIVPLLGSVTHAARLQDVMQAWLPHTVYHAAAYKHVPLVEHNPMQGVRNNVFGTLVTARAAQAAGVRRFVLVSTDKAVRPTNIMGASKRLSELALQGLAQEPSQTCFSMVRFGNVLGSSGSVVPLFRKQIEAGGPITLTHADITRYFMTIPEAAQLVIQAGAMAAGGEVFVLDMGEPVRIIDLARRMVDLSGRTVRDADNPHGDIALEVTGLRPGEKLYEELLTADNAQPTAHARVMKAYDPCPPAEQLWQDFEVLETLLVDNDVPALKRLLQTMLPGYQPHAEVVDWVHVQRQHAARQFTPSPRSAAHEAAGQPVTANNRPAPLATA